MEGALGDFDEAFGSGMNRGILMPLNDGFLAQGHSLFSKMASRKATVAFQTSPKRHPLKRRGVSVDLAWNTAKSAHGPWRLSQSPA